jgi:hypothetical protein
MLWVIKHGSSVLYFVSSAAVIPIVSLVSTTPWYHSVGLATVAFSVWQVVGLVLVVAGGVLFVYFLRRDATAHTSRSASRSLKDLAGSDNPFLLSAADDIITEPYYEDEQWDTHYVPSVSEDDSV